jgi:hypothetical protein
MANLVTTEANNILNASSGQAAFTAVSGGTGTQKVALNISPTASTAAAQGTEASGGAGPYARQTITFSAASAGSITNNLALSYTGMPACTVTGVDEFDANGTTRRWFGALSSSKTVNAGDTFSIATSSYTKTLS